MKEFAADSGASVSVANQAATDDAQFVHLDLDLIVPSLTNRQIRMDADELAELAETIKDRGVRDPIVVRPLPGSRVEETAFKPGGLERRAKRPTHEIVSGERRYHASILAGKTTIPALIRNLTDQQAQEDQLIENLQRVDLTDLEEAEGYERLIQGGRTVEEVGRKIGKKKGYVYGHLKLLDLTAASKAALRDGEVEYSHALLIARIPDDKLQAKAIKYASTPQGYPPSKPGLRDFQTWLRQNVMLRLDTAPFKITDARLVEAAGSCKECPKRTGANPELFAEVDGQDICTDPGCYAEKAKAHRATLVSKAEAKGMRVIDGKEAKALFKGVHTDRMEGYSRLDQKRLDVSPEGATLKKLLGDKAPAPVLIEHPGTKELIEAVPTAEAEAVLVANGLLAAHKATPQAKDKLDQQIEHLRDRIATRTAVESRLAIFQALGKKVHAAKDDKVLALLTAPLLRLHLTMIFDSYDIDAGDEEWAVILNTAVPEKVEASDFAIEAVSAAPMATLWKLLITYLLLDDCNGYNSKTTPAFDAVAKSLRVDTAAIAAAKKAQIREEVNAQIKELRDAAKKALAASAPKAKEAKSQPAATGRKPGKQPSMAFMNPLHPSQELAAVVGAEPRIRTEIVSRLWEYIKKHDLQDKTNKRMINCDTLLQAVFRKPQVSMFEMAGLIGSHVQSKPHADSPLAQPKAKAGKNEGRAPAPKAKKGKLSVEEAQLGIAFAMQGAEGKAAPAALQPVSAWPFPTAPADTATPTLKAGKAADKAGAAQPGEESDPLFTQAVALVVREQKANVRLLKTELGIGTAKALLLMESLEKAGKVSACDQRGAREVLVTA